MLFVKLGVLAFLGKQYYLSFAVANLITHSTHSLKTKLMEVVK